MSEWKPIETAPQDGTLILGHDSVADWPELVLFDDGQWYDRSGFLYEPTHWQPLPEPPQ